MFCFVSSFQNYQWHLSLYCFFSGYIQQQQPELEQREQQIIKHSNQNFKVKLKQNVEKQLMMMSFALSLSLYICLVIINDDDDNNVISDAEYESAREGERENCQMIFCFVLFFF